MSKALVSCLVILLAVQLPVLFRQPRIAEYERFMEMEHEVTRWFEDHMTLKSLWLVATPSPVAVPPPTATPMTASRSPPHTTRHARGRDAGNRVADLVDAPLPAQDDAATTLSAYLYHGCMVLFRLYLRMTAVLVWIPLIQLFLNGPAWFGFWHGLPHEDICAQLTRVDARHWIEHMGACQKQILQHLDGLIVTCHYVLLLIVVWHMYRWLTAPASTLSTAETLLLRLLATPPTPCSVARGSVGWKSRDPGSNKGGGVCRDDQPSGV